jgi:hypothetical protein
MDVTNAPEFSQPPLTCENNLPLVPVMIEGRFPSHTTHEQENQGSATAPAVGLLKEAWKPIGALYPAYEASPVVEAKASTGQPSKVSTAGAVRRISTGRMLKQTTPKGGTQPYVTMTDATGKQRTVQVKQAVMLAHQPAYAPPDARIVQIFDDSHRLVNLAWLDDELRLWGTDAYGNAVYVQTAPTGRRRAWGYCGVGHQISTTGKPDCNTMVWGRGNRICLACERGDRRPEGWGRPIRRSRKTAASSKWDGAPRVNYSYSQQWGVATMNNRST